MYVDSIEEQLRKETAISRNRLSVIWSTSFASVFAIIYSVVSFILDFGLIKAHCQATTRLQLVQVAESDLFQKEKFCQEEREIYVLRDTRIFAIASRASFLLVLACALASTAGAQTCTGGSLTACNASCSNTDSTCVKRAGVNFAACNAAVAVSYASCVAIATSAWSACYEECDLLGGNVTQCKIGCDYGKTNSMYGCSAGDAGGVAGCSIANQVQLQGCASTLTSCDSTCATACH
jgi:hypothetical protein